MAAYAATVTSKMKRAVKIDAVHGIGMYAGSVDVTNYNQTLAEITDITGKFKDVISVVAGATDNGHVLRWNGTSGAFEAYYGAYDETVEGALAEVASDVDVGASDFIAIGFV